MHIDDEQYFRSCIAKERHLAQLLGHQHIEECYESAGTLWDGALALPKWTRDWSACGPLLSRFALSLTFGLAGGSLQAHSITVGATTVHFEDHPSSDQAVRVAIVKEIIFRLEHVKI